MIDKSATAPIKRPMSQHYETNEEPTERNKRHIGQKL